MTTRRPLGQLPSIMLGAALSIFVSALAGVVHERLPLVNERPLLPDTSLAAQAPADLYKDVYDGWKWWHVYCYRCHGTNAIATTLAPDLIDPNRRLTDAQFLKVVRDGVPDKGMQAWDKLLDNKQISQIHMYVRARTDKVLPPGRPDEVGPKGGQWVPPAGWPKR
jgi:mono/diheme cytochrome c family protein